jgi:phosphatidylglycerophosphatase A
MAPRVATVLVRVFGIGNAPVSPGTFGSLPGLGVAYLLHAYVRDPWLIGVALLALTALSYWAIAVYEKALGVHDDQRVVIDEVCGQAIAAAFLPVTVAWYGAAFALFRLLDIAKPPPIGTIDEKVPGAAGTLFDDVVAGVFAAVILLSISAFLGA